MTRLSRPAGEAGGWRLPPPVRSMGLIAAGWLACQLAIGYAPPAGAGQAVDSNTAAPTALQQFRQLYAKEWAFRMAEFPLSATWNRVPGYDDQLGRVSAQHQRRRHDYWQGILRELDGIALDTLPRAERINARIFRRQIESFISDYRFKAYFIPLTSDEGFHTSLARMPRVMRFSQGQDYENYLRRLQQIPRVFAEHQALMESGLEAGMTLPQVVLQGRSKAFRDQVVEDPAASTYFEPFRQRPPGVEEAHWNRLIRRAKDVIKNNIVPAYAQFARFFEQHYIPGARRTTAAKELPDGAAYYRDRVAYYTTLEISPQDVHQLGLREVTRIRAQMQAIVDELEYPGSFAEFLQFLRSDPQFYAKTGDELLMHAAWTAKRAEAALPGLFSHFPRQPYGVAPVPAEIAPYYTSGRYSPAPLGGTEAAYYWVNTYQLDSRPLYALPALTLHEAVPGHHLQNAIAAELGELPDFRSSDYISAFGEGWALYAEYLGVEAGIYRTPYEHFGRLTYEMWRACRLVVDTGLHWHGWSRQRALDYLAENTALSLHEITTEVDRYISWPGQALSYKMGELTIKRLRQEAEQALGSTFDLRAFHDAILAQGSVPLPILEQEIRAYIADKTAATAAVEQTPTTGHAGAARADHRTGTPSP